MKKDLGLGICDKWIVLGTAVDGEHLVLRNTETGEISVLKVDPGTYLQIEIWLSSQNKPE